ncbi:hypothetical protein INR49_029875 [Caranx melampygus]|nr:hypothetical protein INR49_029875 [Caranx melampygus]
MSPSDPCSGILTAGVSQKDGENWCSQINRLQQLLDKLECQSPKLEPLKEDTLASTYKSNILLVQRQMSMTTEDLDNFQKVLKSYIDATSAHSDNLHYLQSNSSKDFQRCIIDMLEDAEIVSTMLLPALCFKDMVVLSNFCPLASGAEAGVEGVEEREATEAFSPLGLEAEGTLSGALTPARPTGDTPAAAAATAAVAMAATLPAVMAETDLG